MSERPTTEPRLEPLSEEDFATVAALGGEIWREHYTKLIGAEQVEYMLGERYSPERLRPYLGANDRWFRLLWTDAGAVGYCSYALTTPTEMKLEQLYLKSSARGTGAGGLMLRHVESEARARGRKTLMLTVNRDNQGAIAVYRKFGFTVREEVVIDIGGGFVMDDFVMVKPL